jgi:hypothetical protein
MRLRLFTGRVHVVYWVQFAEIVTVKACHLYWNWKRREYTVESEIFSTNAWNFYWNWKRKEAYYSLLKNEKIWK